MGHEGSKDAKNRMEPNECKSNMLARAKLFHLKACDVFQSAYYGNCNVIYLFDLLRFLVNKEKMLRRIRDVYAERRNEINEGVND